MRFLLSDYQADPKPAMDYANEHGGALVVDAEGRERVYISIPTKDLPTMPTEEEHATNLHNAAIVAAARRWRETSKQGLRGQQTDEGRLWTDFLVLLDGAGVPVTVHKP